MNLLVDIGNTRIKWGLAERDRLAETGAIASIETSNWAAELPHGPIAAIIVASVADSRAIEALAAHAEQRGVVLHRVVSTARCGSLINGYTQPERLGVDRWMACIAAWARGSGSVLVADVGTALTLDWIAGDGRHGGGLIAPGVANMRSALCTSTQLRPRQTSDDDSWLARDTDSAIAAGTLRCASALLNAAVHDLVPDRLLLTGGEAPLLAPRLTRRWTLAPHLVLEGLAIRAQRIGRASHHEAEASK